MPNLDGAYNLCIQLCNSTNPYCRYSQQSNLRAGGISGGYQWFDCSGLMWYVLRNNGFTMPSSAFSTASEVQDLKTAGFIEVDINGEWKPADILWRRKDGSGHTEMVYSGGIGSGVTMGAHSSKLSIDRQVSINNAKSYAKSWMKLLRYQDGGVIPTPVPVNWINGRNDEYFTAFGAEQKNNAILVHNFFEARGWSHEAIAGMLANMQHESTLNPSAIEHGKTDVTKAGHGLVQWTPQSALFTPLDVLFGGHDVWESGDKQCQVIYAEYEEASGLAHRGIEKQWYSTSAYPMTFAEFASSTASPEDLASAWMHNYERPASYDHELERRVDARLWYDFLKVVDDGGETKKHHMPVWMMALRR